MKEYKWKRAEFGKLSAEIAVKALCSIQKKHGALTPDVVVKEARKKKSPLHNCFEWDDTKAAAQYRIEQAKYLIRKIEVVFTDDSGTKEPLRIRAFHSILCDDDSHEYVTLKQARDDIEIWEQVKQQAIDALIAWKAKFSAFKEFEAIYQMIDSLKK